MIKSQIQDGLGTGQRVQVTDDNELVVVQSTSPPLAPQKTQIFTQYLTDDGLSSGSNDMGIDGTVTPTTFFIPTDRDNDRYITQLSFVLGYSTTGGLWEFADSGADLTNGVVINYIDNTGIETEIVTILDNSDLLRISKMDGIVYDNWELRNLGAIADYGLLAVVNLGDIVKPYGIQLTRGTRQQLSIKITDDVTSATTFNCRAIGFERYK